MLSANALNLQLSPDFIARCTTDRQGRTVFTYTLGSSCRPVSSALGVRQTGSYNAPAQSLRIFRLGRSDVPSCRSDSKAWAKHGPCSESLDSGFCRAPVPVGTAETTLRAKDINQVYFP